jgi:hypothetical protein
MALRHSSVYHGTRERRGVLDDWGIYCEAARSTVLVKYSTMDITDGNSWSSKTNDFEKPIQSARLVV